MPAEIVVVAVMIQRLLPAQGTSVVWVNPHIGCCFSEAGHCRRKLPPVISSENSEIQKALLSQSLFMDPNRLRPKLSKQVRVKQLANMVSQIAWDAVSHSQHCYDFSD